MIFPNELWLQIISFLPDKDLLPLQTVNRLFHDAATQRKFESFVIDDLLSQALEDKLCRIEQDPFIAARARSLKILPKAIHSACLHWGEHNLTTTRPVKNPHWPSEFRTLTESSPIGEDTFLADRLLDAVAHFSSVRSYTIEWRGALRDHLKSSFYLSFLSAVWSILPCSILHTLTLDMPFDHLRDVVSLMPTSNLTSLNTISLIFTSTGFFTPVSDNSANFDMFYHWEAIERPHHKLDDLASFINRFSPSLQSLTLCALGHFALSGLFEPLQHFFHLRHLNLSIPCDADHFIDSAAFTTFLETHATQLETLSFTPQFCHCSESLDEQLNFPNELKFPKISLLELGLKHGFVRTSLERIAEAVSRGRRRPQEGNYEDDVPLTLNIVGSITSLENLQRLLLPFSPVPGFPVTITPLQTLILEIDISFDLFNLLSSALPQLETLDLTYHSVEQGKAKKSHMTRDFVRKLKRTSYPQWRLKRLYLRYSGKDEKAHHACQMAIMHPVPSLQQ